MIANDSAAEQIIVVKRRGGEGDEAHHGGVWKIAYADFMTAMMAFFLVMWLINAANTETKASVASYFNPIKLTDNVARKKGLRDLDERANASEKPKQEQKIQKSKPATGGPQFNLQNQVEAVEQPGGRYEHPVGGDSAPDPQHLGKGEPVTGHKREVGRSFLDPFTPLAGSLINPGEGTRQQGGEVSASARTSKSVERQSAELAEKQAEKAAAILQTARAAVRQLGLVAGPGIEVTIENDAIILSLTDTSDFGMFQIGSADPNGDLVRLLQKLSPMLAENADRIIVRGHTDARPYRVGSKDSNWRLAMARAEAAYAMLRQSAIEEARFERIEAYADHKLKDPKKPEAAVNRRIEIVLRKAS